ncbi:MAG: hypothetical protein JWO67_4517 [Streptosporangiaceae bacterium]|nr:hypothetical protein [Streptosporangiaceae bacterium]
MKTSLRFLLVMVFTVALTCLVNLVMDRVTHNAWLSGAGLLISMPVSLAIGWWAPDYFEKWIEK